MLIYGLSALYCIEYLIVFFRIFPPHDKSFEIFIITKSPFFK